MMNKGQIEWRIQIINDQQLTNLAKISLKSPLQDIIKLTKNKQVGMYGNLCNWLIEIAKKNSIKIE